MRNNSIPSVERLDVKWSHHHKSATPTPPMPEPSDETAANSKGYEEVRGVLV